MTTILPKCCCFFFLPSTIQQTKTACLSFTCAIFGMTTDDISFKLLIDAWSPGIVKSLFVATASPAVLALSLVPFFMVVQFVLGRLLVEGEQQHHEEGEDGVEVELGRPYYHSLLLGNHNDDNNNSSTSFFQDETITTTTTTTTTTIPFQTKTATTLLLYPKPNYTHIPLAILDHTTTILATLGGPKTPGHVQVLINQTMLPLTALFSYLVFGRKYTAFQILSACVIVLGTILTGVGSTQTHSGNEDDTAESHDDDDDGEEEEDVFILGKNISICLFVLAQIPNASSAVWKEYILKKSTLSTTALHNMNPTTRLKKSLSSSSSMNMMMTEMTTCRHSSSSSFENEKEEEHQQNTELLNTSSQSKEEEEEEEDEQKEQQWQEQYNQPLISPPKQQQEENISMPLRIIHLATCISIIRSILAVTSFSILSIFLPSSTTTTTTTNPIQECLTHLLQNTNSATTLLLLNNITYIYSKLASLQVVAEANNGGAFLSVLAGCIAMPLQILLFRVIYGREREGVGGGDMTDWGLGCTLMGMVMYMMAVPEQFGGGGLGDLGCWKRRIWFWE